MSYTNGLDKPSDYFNTKLYTGTNATQSITGVNFQPDFSWFKTRNDSNGHTWIDSVRGITKRLASHNTQGDITQADMLTSFDTDGLTLGADSNNYTNWSGKTWVVWNWLASNSTASNTDGSITSTVSANQTSGFSIVTWTGSGSSATIGHGLGSTPKFIIVKNRTDSVNWFVYHHSVITASATNKSFMTLNTTDALGTNGSATTFTSVSDTTFGVGTDNIINGSSDNMIAYVFADTGNKFFKAGKYTGNGSASGPYIYTGHKPAAIIIKRTDVAKNWYINDNLRLGYNNNNPYISPNLSVAETGGTEIDILSNGFRITAGGTGHNQSGGTYMYASIAENPFVTGTLGIPCTAR